MTIFRKIVFIEALISLLNIIFLALLLAGLVEYTNPLDNLFFLTSLSLFIGTWLLLVITGIIHFINAKHSERRIHKIAGILSMIGISVLSLSFDILIYQEDKRKHTDNLSKNEAIINSRTNYEYKAYSPEQLVLIESIIKLEDQTDVKMNQKEWSKINPQINSKDLEKIFYGFSKLVEYSLFDKE